MNFYAVQKVYHGFWKSAKFGFSSWNLKLRIQHSHKSSFSSLILGIETSCDDTGCAIVNDLGLVLGETLYSQHLVHLRYGGIIPDVAQDLHRECIEPVVEDTLHKAHLSINDLDAIAVTVRPGLPLSLAVGMKYAKHLSRLHKKPLIPIHHMEAHALVARMQHSDISFPFLVLLISGGHCLLAVAKDIEDFILLGESMDQAPGDIFDKTARRMKLRNMPEYSKLPGGQAIELAATQATNPHIFEFPLPIVEYKDCNFSFNGLKTSVIKKLTQKEKEHNITGDTVIPEIYDLCASFQMAVCRHLVHRTQRAMEFCKINKIIPEGKKQLIVSGGVACNNFIFKALKMLTDEMNYEIYRPVPKLCTDNGVMIAWNGIEKWRRGCGVLTDFSAVDIESKSPMGTNYIPEVIKAKIPTKVIKLKGLL